MSGMDRASSHASTLVKAKGIDIPAACEAWSTDRIDGEVESLLMAHLNSVSDIWVEEPEGVQLIHAEA